MNHQLWTILKKTLECVQFVCTKISNKTSESVLSACTGSFERYWTRDNKVFNLQIGSFENKILESSDGSSHALHWQFWIISNKTLESVRSACTGSFERSASGVEALFLLFLLAAVEKCLSSDPLLSHSSRFGPWRDFWRFAAARNKGRKDLHWELGLRGGPCSLCLTHRGANAGLKQSLFGFRPASLRPHT